MANGIYTKWLDEVALASLTRDPHVVLLLAGGYVPNPDEHQLRADIPSSAELAEASLNNPRIENGVLFADDVVFANVASSVNASTIVLANAATGRLVIFLQDVTGLQVAANATDLVLMFDPDCGIFGV